MVQAMSGALAPGIQVQSRGAVPPIDREALVTRHNVTIDKQDPASPLQVGNGQFAFGADITGLQTFIPFNTMSHWGWHSSPPPPGTRPEDFRGEVWDTHGRAVEYPMGKGPLAEWLTGNPHRLNLGRIGLALVKKNGEPAVLEDLRRTRQQLDLWRGLLSSSFELEGESVKVETLCDPALDAVAVRIESPLLGTGRLGVRFSFPGGDTRSFAQYAGDTEHPDRHSTRMSPEPSGARFVRQLDGDRYDVRLGWSGPLELRQEKPHSFLLRPSGAANAIEFVALFEPSPGASALPSFAGVKAACARRWPEFWRSGGAIDLSGSHDSRWRELERRIVLSQYLMAVNEAGSWPPQEAGLVNNGWFGRFHFEMYWWHAAHYALWNRWPLLERSLGVYRTFLDSAKRKAQGQGYAGARWPKCTGPDGREFPHPIHALLIWQQPHPMFFAELDYRAHPGPATLEKWRAVVSESADFMASYAFRDAGGRYVLGPPLYVVSENTDPKTTQNPAFELAYWRFGLRVAQTWRTRLGLGRNPEWDKVLNGLSPLPEQDGVYVLHEGVRDMWTRWNWEHPALIGVYGMLPGDGVSVETARRTLEKVTSCWRFERTWGWDFPMAAMAAARLGEPEQAVDFLLHPARGFQFDQAGLATGGPFPYFPSNGALLYAVAMMAAGWDGAPDRPAPGFPADRWTVRAEGLSKAI
jgi:hypothetical protein